MVNLNKLRSGDAVTVGDFVVMVRLSQYDQKWMISIHDKGGDWLSQKKVEYSMGEDPWAHLLKINGSAKPSKFMIEFNETVGEMVEYAFDVVVKAMKDGGYAVANREASVRASVVREMLNNVREHVLLVYQNVEHYNSMLKR